MSPQADYIVANGTGAAVRSDVNGQLAAIVSNNSGATEPTTMYAYQWWADTTTGLLKQRNAANSAWITIGTLASANLGLLSLAGGTMTGVLAVTAGTAALPGIAVSGDLNTGLFSPGADTVALVTGGTQRATIDSSGRLLVGTSSSESLTGDQYKIQIKGTDASAGLSIHRSQTNNAPTYLALAKSRSGAIVSSGDGLGAINFIGHDGVDLDSIAATIECLVDGTPGTDDMPGRLVFSTTADGAASPTERMRIGNDGILYNVSTSHAVIASTTAAAGLGYYLFVGRYGATAGSAGSGTNSIEIYSNGNVRNTNNSYTAISDLKLKENVVDANSQWDDIKALRVRNYNLKEGQTHKQIGLIAQEVEPISPGLVYETTDLDADNTDLGTTTKSVQYSVLYMKAVKALQEAMERIESLEAKVAALEAV